MKAIRYLLAGLIFVFGAAVFQTPATATDEAFAWRAYTGGCRAPDGGQGSYKLHRGVSSVDACKNRCIGHKGLVACSAVEYNPGNGACEVHKGRIAGGSGDRTHGTVCYKVQR